MSTPSPRQAVENSHAGRDINQSLTITGGSSLGAGVWRWPDWEDRVRAGAPGVLAASTRLILDGRAISRNAGHDVIAMARDFLDGIAERRAITVLGKHGTGRSTLAVATAKALSSEGYEDVYIVDDYLRFVQSDLVDLLPAGRRSMLVIDDADIQSAFRPLYNAIGVVDICALTTVASPRLARTYAALDSRPSEVVTLPGRPDGGEIESLREVTSGPRLGRRRERLLERYNIRSVFRILDGDGPPEELARRLAQLRYEDRATALAMSILSKCGEHDIAMPSTLLTRAMGEGLPEALVSWLQTRPLLGGNDEAQAIWIEDHEVLALGERLWRSEYVLDDGIYVQEVRDVLERLLGAVIPSNLGDRLVGRQFLKRSPVPTAIHLANALTDKVVECIAEEADRASVLAWQAAIPSHGVIEGERIRRSVIQQFERVEPDFGTLIAFLLETSDKSRLTDDDITILAGMASIDQWAKVLELFEGEPGKALTNATLHVVLDCIRACSDAEQVVTIRNSAQILGGTVADRGLHYHRTWLRDAFLAADRLRLSHLPFLLRVTKRCVMQGRHHLTLDEKWNPPSATEGDVSALALEYNRLLEARGADRVNEVTARALSSITDLTTTPAVRDQAWGQVIEFTDYYNRSQLETVCRGALAFCLDVWTSTGLSSCHEALVKVLQKTFRARVVTADTISKLLRLAKDPGFGALYPGTVIFPLLEAAVVCEEDDVRLAAISALRAAGRACAGVDDADFDEAWRQFSNLFSDESDTYSLIGDLDFNSDRTAIVSNVAALRTLQMWPEAQRDAHLRLLVERWGQDRGWRPRIFSACLTAAKLDLARSVIPEDWIESSSWRFDVARLNAAQGDLQAARRLLLDARLTGDRANPVRVSLAEYELGMATIGFERRMWLMLSRLTMPGELQSIPELAPPRSAS